MARHHFHERVGESPRREKNFGTTGSIKSCFVSEIWPFEIGICVRADYLGTYLQGAKQKCSGVDNTYLLIIHYFVVVLKHICGWQYLMV